jgi:hypothetical protein
MNEKEIYSTKLKKGNRTYFFDLKRSNNENLYLNISESKKTDSGFKRSNVIVFEEYLGEFFDSINLALTKYMELKSSAFEERKKYSIEQIRHLPPKAYLPWTDEDDNLLERNFSEGKKIKELAEILKRKKGAITSRIKKLGLKEKYGK